MKRIPNKIIGFLANFRDWAFETPTRIIELFSGFCAFFFSLAFLFDASLFVLNHPFRNFSYISNEWLWLLMFLLSILQITYSSKTSNKSNQKSAQLSLWFSLVWAIIAIVFATDYPPISTAFFTYMMLSMVNLMNYFYLDHVNKSKIIEIK